MLKNMLGNPAALGELLSGPLADLAMKLAGATGQLWQMEFDKFLRAESCWNNFFTRLVEEAGILGLSDSVLKHKIRVDVLPTTPLGQFGLFEINPKKYAGPLFRPDYRCADPGELLRYAALDPTVWDRGVVITPLDLRSDLDPNSECLVLWGLDGKRELQLCPYKTFQDGKILAVRV